MTRRASRQMRLRREHWLGLLVLLIAIAVLLYGSQPRPALQIVFLDVGQGDAVLIRTSEGQTALYDGGRSGSQLMEYLEGLGVTHLDIVIASHADFDHIGGLVRAVQAFPPRYFMDNGMPHTTEAYENLLDAVEAAESTYLEATERTLRLGTTELVLLPPPGTGTDQNENSIGIIVRYGDFQALLSGDATTRQQVYWQEQHAALLQETHVYKAAHHGSRTGDREAFIRLVDPEAVVISAGLDSQYGHPHAETLASYRQVNAEIYRTDRQGHIAVNVPQPGTVGYSVQTGELPQSSDAPVDVLSFILDLVEGMLEL